jgi:TrpR family transcriptional regulator, trp operon repressor
MKKQEMEDGWWRFLKLCTQVKTVDRWQSFFDLFLTIEEKENLAMRYLLVKALLEGKKTQREIAKELKISISKITRGSNALKEIDDPLREFLKKAMA